MCSIYRVSEGERERKEGRKTSALHMRGTSRRRRPTLSSERESRRREGKRATGRRRSEATANPHTHALLSICSCLARRCPPLALALPLCVRVSLRATVSERVFAPATMSPLLALLLLVSLSTANRGEPCFLCLLQDAPVASASSFASPISSTRVSS